MVLEQDQPMAGLTVLEEVAGGHCIGPLNSAVTWTMYEESCCWRKHWSRRYLKTSGYDRLPASE